MRHANHGLLVCLMAIVLTFSAETLCGAEILFVGGGDPDPTSGDDFEVFDFLTETLGHDVTYLSGNASTTEDGEEVDLIIISSTLGSGSVRGKFQELSTPILNWEEALMDGTTAGGNFAMAAASQNGGGLEGTEIEIINPNHPLAAGLNGVVEFSIDPIRLPFVTPPVAPGVVKVAKLPGDDDIIELSPSGTGMHIGTTQNVTNPFVGRMDEIAIYDKSLSFDVDANNTVVGGDVHTLFTQGVSAVTDPKPIGYWSFDDVDDPFTATDGSENGFDAILNGSAELVAGNTAPNVGGAGALVRDFDGEVDVPDMERPGGELAYSFWFNASSSEYGDTLEASDGRIDLFYGNGNGGTVRPHLSVNRNGRPLGLYVNANGDVGTPIEASTDEFSTDEWHHVVISWDGRDGSVFVDGKLDNVVTLSNTAFTITAVDAGGELTDGTLAAGPRVNFPIENTGFASLTDDGLSLFAAAVDWLLGNSAVPGDFNGDGSLTVEDVDALNATIAANTNDGKFDLTGDGVVDPADLDVWVVDLKKTWFGDANLDGQFNTNDLITVFQGGLFETESDASWGSGDWTGDKRFNTSDLIRAFQDGGFEQGPRGAVAAAVPEPGSFLLFALGFAALLGAARRRIV